VDALRIVAAGAWSPKRPGTIFEFMRATLQACALEHVTAFRFHFTRSRWVLPYELGGLTEDTVHYPKRLEEELQQAVHLASRGSMLHTCLTLKLRKATSKQSHRRT
jgi:hypothetical protein